jgi:hypothetical protein
MRLNSPAIAAWLVVIEYKLHIQRSLLIIGNSHAGSLRRKIVNRVLPRHDGCGLFE